MRWISRLTTFAIALAAVVGGALWIYSKIPSPHVGKGFTTFAFFRDASRLAKGSPVRIAGVKVGDVTSLVVRGQLARVDMLLDDQVAIPTDSFVTKRSESAFGDNYLEILPGEGTTYLKEKDEIEHVIEGTSTDALLRGMARNMPKVDQSLDQVHDIVTTGRRWVNDKLGDGVATMGHWIDDDSHLATPLRKADAAMQRIEDGATSAEGKLANATPDLIAKLESYDRKIRDARKGIADFKVSLTDGMKNVREGLDGADQQIDDYTALMDAINEGKGDDWKGTLGRLVNDPTLANDIEDVTQSLANGTDGLLRLHSFIGVRGEYALFASHPRAYATAEIRARNDKYYVIEFETGPQGAQAVDSLTDYPSSGSFTRTTTVDDSPRFTFQIGKQLGRLGLRFGLKESTLGIGADLLFFQGRLKISTDVFGSFDAVPRLKVAGAVQVFRDLYIIGGIDDALNAPHYIETELGDVSVPHRFQTFRYGRDYFLGGSLQFTDEDLAVLVRVYGAMLVGLITR